MIRSKFAEHVVFHRKSVYPPESRKGYVEVFREKELWGDFISYWLKGPFDQPLLEDVQEYEEEPAQLGRDYPDFSSVYQYFASMTAHISTATTTGTSYSTQLASSLIETKREASRFYMRNDLIRLGHLAGWRPHPQQVVFFPLEEEARVEHASVGIFERLKVKDLLLGRTISYPPSEGDIQTVIDYLYDECLPGYRELKSVTERTRLKKIVTYWSHFLRRWKGYLAQVPLEE